MSAEESAPSSPPVADDAVLKPLPDLDAVFDDFLDAHAIVHTACRVLEECNSDEDQGAAMLTLRQGLKALATVSDRLGKAARELSRRRREGDGAS